MKNATVTEIRKSKGATFTAYSKHPALHGYYYRIMGCGSTKAAAIRWLKEGYTVTIGLIHKGRDFTRANN